MPRKYSMLTDPLLAFLLGKLRCFELFKTDFFVSSVEWKKCHSSQLLLSYWTTGDERWSAPQPFVHHGIHSNTKTHFVLLSLGNIFFKKVFFSGLTIKTLVWCFQNQNTRPVHPQEKLFFVLHLFLYLSVLSCSRLCNDLGGEGSLIEEKKKRGPLINHTGKNQSSRL